MNNCINYINSVNTPQTPQMSTLWVILAMASATM